MNTQSLDELRGTRYALLRTFRRDGTPVDTPVWFGVDGNALVFRTKVGPKTRRLTAQPDVELTACDHKGRAPHGAATLRGRATILSDDEAERANRVLRKRYGWQCNFLPLIKIPGVVNVHRDLSICDKLRYARNRAVWPDSFIVRVELQRREQKASRI